MFKTIAAIAFGAAVTLTPLAVRAEMKPSPMVMAQSTTPAHAHRPTRSYRSEMRHRSNMSRERARAGAEHVRTMHKQ